METYPTCHENKSILLLYNCFFLTFQESSVLIGGGAIVLFLILAERFTLMYFGLLLKPTLPEGDFLNPYGTTVPVIFTVLLYLVYLAILFCYHNELKHLDSQERTSSPINFHSPRHIRPASQAGTPSALPWDPLQEDTIETGSI